MNRFHFRWLQSAFLLVFLSGVIAPPPGFSARAIVRKVPAGRASLGGAARTPSRSAAVNLAAANPRPTIQLDPDQGYAGQTVTVQGAAPAGYPQVRVAWWVGEATRTAQIVTIEPDLSYQAALSVPEDAAPALVQICAALAGGGEDSELAEFACAPFTIVPPPPANLSGSIPTTSSRALGAIAADLLLVDQNGSLAARAPIASDGSFSFLQLPPGNYTAGVVGDLPILVEPQGISIAPGSNAALDLAAATWAACTYMPAAAVTDILVSPGMQTGLTAPGTPKSVGTYLSLSALGPIVPLTIQALLQVANGASVQRVEFWLQRPDGFTIKVAQDSTFPYQFNYNASLLMVGKTKITAKVNMTDGACTKPKDIYLHAIAHPFNSPVLKNTSINWNAALARYEFSADIPNLPGDLPALYPDPAPSIPLVGKLENKLDAWEHFEGHLNLNRQITLHLMQYHAYARVISQTILNKTETWWGSEHSIGYAGDSKPPKMGFGPSTMLQFNKTFPVFSGPLWTFAGIVTVNASIKVGLNGSVILQGWLEPWTPSTNMRLMPNVSPYIPISVWLDILLLIGKVGITGTTSLGFGLPLQVNTKTADPVYFDNPCVSLKIVLEGWAEIYYYFDTAHWDLFDFEILNKSWGSCALADQLASAAARRPQQVAELRSLPAPEIASSASGQMGMVYVEDTTPAAASTTPRVMARFYDPDQNGWGPATAISEPEFFVKDPVIAFVGASGEALAAWSQNTLSRAQGAALGRDVSAIFAHQEIFFAYWNGSDWSAPQQLTDDNLADGAAAIAGDSAGGATLAWVVDTDGNLATQSDVEIATQEWDGAWSPGSPLPQAWGPRKLMGLRGPADTALDAQVRVIRPATRTLTSVLVWTHDEDADLKTNADRALVVARLAGGVWSTETLFDLPSGVDLPALAWDSAAQILHLAFLERGKDEDGLTDTGPGNLGELWTVQWDAANGWYGVQPLLQDGQPVRAERPLLLAAPGQDVSLLFRRFDEPGTPGAAGALALSQLPPRGGGYSAPLYLTPQTSMNWMQAATTYNASQLVLVSMNRPLVLPGSTGAEQPSSAIPSASGAQTWRLPVAGTTETLETSLIVFAPDPALDAGLEIAPLHASSGVPVTITTTLRNLGREIAADMTVRLYAGAPGSATLLDLQTFAGPLAFNESQTVVFNAVSTGGPQPFYAELLPGGADVDTGNNLALGDAGIFPPPRWLNVQPASGPESSLLLSWMPPETAGVTGYRILRSAAHLDPYELVGLSLGTFFEDADLPRGTDYFYVVQAYDAEGDWSAYSA